MPLNSLLARTRREDGSTLVPVVAVVAVAMLLTVVVATSTIQALAFTSTTRAGIQAQAAADAGIDFTVSLVEADLCRTEVDRTYGEVYSPAELTALGIEAAAPFFEATVQHRQVLPGLLSNQGWTTGCPSDLLSGLLGGSILTYQLRVESTGYASAPGLLGASGLDEHTVEAVYGWDLLAAPSSPGITPTGAAVYAHSSAGFGAGGEFYSVDGSVPNAKIKKGDVLCSGAFEGLSTLFVGDGKFTGTGSCTVAGSVWASKQFEISGSVWVAGDVVASGAKLSGSAQVLERLWSSGSLEITGNPRIAGAVKASSLRLDGGTLAAGGFIYGATNVVNAGATTLGGPVVTQSAANVSNWWGGRT